MEPDTETTTPLQARSPTLLGTWRRFGETGPLYEVVGPSQKAARTELRIRVAETGEELDYPLAAIVDDPLA